MSYLSTQVEKIIPWDSAFKIVEAPMSCANKLLNAHGRWPELIFYSPVSQVDFAQSFDKLYKGLQAYNITEIELGAAEVAGRFEALGKHLYDKKITVLATGGQAIFYAMTSILAPFTIIADIFGGSIQASLCSFQGASKEEIQSIVHKKIIASPVQQLAYIYSNFKAVRSVFHSALALATVVASLSFVQNLGESLYAGASFSAGAAHASSVSSKAGAQIVGISIFFHYTLYGDHFYRHAQNMVGELPSVYIPEGYNIFIQNGALNQNGERAFDPEREYGPFSPDFRNSIQRELGKIKDKDKATIFKDLRGWFESKQVPYTLFGFKSKDEVNESDLSKSYKKLALRCHPDRCSQKYELEGTIMIKMINKAKEHVEIKVLNNKALY